MSAETAVPRLSARVSPHGYIDLVDAVGWRAPEVTCWLGPHVSILGWGCAWRVGLSGRAQAARASGLWQALAERAVVRVSDGAGDCPVAAPLALGSFAFADGGSVLVAPACALVTCGSRAWWIEQAEEGAVPGATPSEVRSALAAAQPLPDPGVARVDGGTSIPHYLGALERAIAALRAGAVSKVVISREVRVRASRAVEPGWLAHRLARAYPTCWTYAVDGFVGATPEMLARVVDGELSVRVLAGTAGPDEGEALWHSGKDQREHRLAVESVRAVLAPLAESLRVPAQPSLLRLPNVTHLSTTVTARVPGTSLQAAGALHPTAAVCGAPRDVAARLIEELEETGRGRYAGPVGWMDRRGNGEWGIALRGGVIDRADPTCVRVRAGGGIMPDSQPEAELRETRAKMRPVLAALGAAESDARDPGAVA